MSQENVEIVRRLREALNARDLDRYYVEFFDPEVEWQTSAEDPDAAIHRGLGAYKRYVERWMESFEGLRADVEEYIDVRDDRVFTWCRYTGRAGRAAHRPTGTWRSSSLSETARLCAVRSTSTETTPSKPQGCRSRRCRRRTLRPPAQRWTPGTVATGTRL
jgi:hypothetical protein